MSGSFKGIDPSLEGSGGKGDDDPRFFTLNYAEILGFEPAHDPDHHHKGNAGAWGSDPLKYLGGPKVVSEFDGFDLAERLGGIADRDFGGVTAAEFAVEARGEPGELLLVDVQREFELLLVHGGIEIGRAHV